MRRAKGGQPIKAVVIGSDRHVVLQSVRDAVFEGLIDPILVGDPATILKLSDEVGFRIDDTEILSASGDEDLARTGRNPRGLLRCRHGGQGTRPHRCVHDRIVDPRCGNTTIRQSHDPLFSHDGSRARAGLDHHRRCSQRCTRCQDETGGDHQRGGTGSFNRHCQAQGCSSVGDRDTLAADAFQHGGRRAYRVGEGRRSGCACLRSACVRQRRIGRSRAIEGDRTSGCGRCRYSGGAEHRSRQCAVQDDGLFQFGLCRGVSSSAGEFPSC